MLCCFLNNILLLFVVVIIIIVQQEFCLQGDKEKSMGLEVSPMCDRDTISLCNMQMGFIEFVVAPLIIGECCVVDVF